MRRPATRGPCKPLEPPARPHRDLPTPTKCAPTHPPAGAQPDQRPEAGLAHPKDGLVQRTPRHIPLHELVQRADEVPAGELWVHCAAGYRASIAASILLAGGHRVIAVDDDYTNAAAAGLPVVAEGGRPGAIT